MTDGAHLEGNRQNTRCQPTSQCQEPNCSDWPEGSLIKGDEVTPVGSGVMVASSGSGPKPLTMPDVQWGTVPKISSGGQCPQCQAGDKREKTDPEDLFFHDVKGCFVTLHLRVNFGV